MRQTIIAMLAAGAACSLAGCQTGAAPFTAATQAAPDQQTGVVERTGPQEQTGVVERTGPQEQTGVVERTGLQEQ